MIVVTGATGNVGRPLVRALAEAGERVTAVSRGVPGDMPEQVRHRRADLSDAESLRPVLDGADALYLLVSGLWFHSQRGPSRVNVSGPVIGCTVFEVVMFGFG